MKRDKYTHTQKSIDYFDEIVRLVKTGLTIQQVLKKVKINKGTFYTAISNEQKLILMRAKATTLKYGVSGNLLIIDSFPIQLEEDPES